MQEDVAVAKRLTKSASAIAYCPSAKNSCLRIDMWDGDSKTLLSARGEEWGKARRWAIVVAILGYFGIRF